MAERDRDGLGEKTERAFRKALWGSCPHQELESPGNGDVIGGEASTSTLQ